MTLIEKVARAIENYKWDGKTDPDGWNGEAQAAIAVVLRDVKHRASGSCDASSYATVRALVDECARENGINLDE